MPLKIFLFTRHLFFPAPNLTEKQFREQIVQIHSKALSERNAKVEQILSALTLPEKEIPARRRYERVILDCKREINEWDWDAQFATLEDSGDRHALYMACFEMATKEPRLRRERFHREGLERVKRLDKDLPPVERREFRAKEVAIAVAHGHIGDNHYKEITNEAADPEGIAARDKLYKSFVVDFFIPHLEKFRGVIEKRDDWSLVEQTRYYWQPKEQLIAKIDKLLALCKLQRNFTDGEKAEWIYELYMAPKFYTEMERSPGAALEYIYWVQGKECVPEGYISPDEERWALEDKLGEQAQKELSDTSRTLREEYEKRGYVGVSS
jgi:hypothetical protein